LDSYRCEKEEGEFEGMWDPFQIETKEQLRHEILQEGHNFWGDHITLQLLQSQLRLNIIILSDLETKTHSLGQEWHHEYQTVVVYYLDGIHFQLVGYFDHGYMRTVFQNNQLPTALWKIYQEDCHSVTSSDTL